MKILFRKTKKSIFYEFFCIYKNSKQISLKNKEKLQKEGCERYKNLYEEEKEKRRKKTWERYQNLSKEDKE